METLKNVPALRNSWPTLLNNFFNRDSFNEGNLNFFDQNNFSTPAVNIKETDRDFSIDLMAPGFAKEDFRVEVDKNLLTISAEKRTENESGENGKYHRREFSYQSVRRSFTLPENIVDADSIKAQYSDGILCLTIPKKEEALPKPAKLIEIS